MTNWQRAALAMSIALTTAACAMTPVRSGTRPRIDLVETALVVMRRVARQCGIPEEEVARQADRLRVVGADLAE